MKTGFARLFSLLTTLEREYGLASLEKEERAIFSFIVSSVAAGADPTAADIVAAGVTSRSSTYRHLASLRKAGLIVPAVKDGRAVFSVGPQLEGFDHSFARMAPEIQG